MVYVGGTHGFCRWHTWFLSVAHMVCVGGTLRRCNLGDVDVDRVNSLGSQRSPFLWKAFVHPQTPVPSSVAQVPAEPSSWYAGMKISMIMYLLKYI